jgi:hypothetical protein
MLEAFASLDAAIDESVTLIVGGGAAMVLAYDHPLATQDVDAFAQRGGLTMSDLDAAAHRVAKLLGIEPDWLNEHFVTYATVLPDDYATRLRTVYEGEHLTVRALGPEDVLVMKCFAGRDKDIAHARRLLRACDDLDLVDAHLAALVARRIPKARAAADFFDDLRDAEDV